jgi:hypothetical protein
MRKGCGLLGGGNVKEMEKEKRVIKMKEMKEEGGPITKPKRKRKVDL